MKKNILLIILLAFTIRLIPSIYAPAGNDIKNYLKIGSMVLQAKNPYTGDNPYPYPPLWMWFEATAAWISQHSSLSFSLVIKLPLIIADLGIVFLLFKFTRQSLPSLLYALNPVSILITGFHGQFDQLVILSLLLALYHSSASFFSLAILLKSFPVILFPIFFFLRKNKLKFLLSVFLPVMLLLAPFLFKNFQAVYQQLFSYQGFPDYGWLATIRSVLSLTNGYYTPVPYTPQLLKMSKIIFLALFALLLLLVKKRRFSLIKSTALVFLLFYFVYGGISSQYLLWVLPFLILVNRRLAIFYSLFATIAILAFYFYAFPEMIAWLFPIPNPLLALKFHLLTNLIFWGHLPWLLFSLIKPHLLFDPKSHIRPFQSAQ